MTMCRFCDFDLSQADLSTEHFFALADRAPATKGHTLVIPRKHHETFLTLRREEWVDLHAALEHFHVIPRYAGDTETPRGGVRNILKPLEELWPE